MRDVARDAAPDVGAAARSRFLFVGITLAVVSFAFRFRHVNDFMRVAPRHATPAHPTIFSCPFRRIEALAAALRAILRVALEHFALETAPAFARTAAMLSRFLGRAITLSALALAFSPRRFVNFAFDAAPARPAIFLRFFRGRIALSFALAAFFPGRLEDFALHAAITFAAIFLGLFRCGVTLAAFRFAILPRGGENLAIDAAPAIPAILERFFLGVVTLAAPLGAFVAWKQQNLVIEAAPTVVRRGRRRRAAAVGRARQRPVPAMGRFGRTGRVIAWRAMPFVTVTAALPPPSTVVLFPNPLATGVTPFAAVNRCRGEEEGMFVAVIGDAFANDQTAIVDALGQGQHFEFCRGKIAERVQIVHLPAGKEEGVFGVVARG